MRWRAALLSGFFALSACTPAPIPDHTVISLPLSLEEVSGLAMATENSVFTHNDEHAIIHEIDVSQGRTLRVFAMGDPTIEGDFEGIAYAAGQVYLITSDGIIYVATPGADGERVPYQTYDTGIAPICEIEGLSNAPATNQLLVLCKRLHRAEEERRLEIYQWTLGADRAEPDPLLSIPLSAILEPDDFAEFRPSALEWDPLRERLIIVSGKSHVFLEIDLEGRLIERRHLDPDIHQQTEGVAILPECRLALADEGTETRQARLSVYPCPS